MTAHPITAADLEAARGIPPVTRHPDIACATSGVDPAAWHAEGHARDAQLARAAAIAVCGRCPHAEECLDWALATRQRFGIWAGTTPAERARRLEADATAAALHADAPHRRTHRRAA